MSTQFEIPILIDEPALMDEGISNDSPVNLSLAGISLKSALRLMLEPLQLTAVIDEQVLKITTIIKAEEMVGIMIYDIHDLPLNGDTNLLIETLTTVIKPESWGEAGGPGTVAQFEMNRTDEKPAKVTLLVVRQTEAVHKKIATLLADLRQVRR